MALARYRETETQTVELRSVDGAKAELKSSQFRREREATWQALESLVTRIDRSGIAAATPAELNRLPLLYRSTLSSLSVARAISLDRALVSYLEILALKAYLCVYGSRSTLRGAIAGFFSTALPRAVRAAAGAVVLSALVLAAGVTVGLVLTQAEPDYFYAFVSEEMAQGRTPTASTEALRETLYTERTTAEQLSAFASFLFTHNAQVGMMCFALGIAFGAPTAILLFHNGLMLGAFVALFASRGLGVELLGWLAIHGTTELLAIILCGGAGFLIAANVIFTGRHSRLHHLSVAGRQAAVIVMGAVVLLFFAAILEGFGRQLIHDTATRFAIGGSALTVLLGYFVLAGRGTAGHRRG